MSEQVRKLRVFEREIDVVDVDFEPEEEHFNRYKLSDGSVIKVKAVVTSIMRVHEQFSPDGDPIYLVYTSPATRVESTPLRPDTTGKQKV